MLIVGSGNIVHNLHTYAWGRQSRDPYDWAVRFESAARELMLAGDYEPLVDYETLGRDALLSIPTPDHYLPLLYVLGCQPERRKHPLSGRRRRWRLDFHAVRAGRLTMRVRVAIAGVALLGLALVVTHALNKLPSLAGRTQSTAIPASGDTRIGRAIGPLTCCTSGIERNPCLDRCA